MVEFNDLQIEKILGIGTFGTSYLVKYKSNNYVLKESKIIKKIKDNIKDYKELIWREIDMYEFINTLNKNDQKFFSKLYDYKINDNCVMCNSLNSDNINDPYFKKLNESKWCVKLLIEYKDGITLKDFLIKNKLTEQQIYSILLQVCNVILILYKGNYSHNDLHLENIIIRETNQKYFSLMNKKIPFNGYQINVIDYGLALHKKYGKNYTKGFIIPKTFIEDPTSHMFNEMFTATYKIINNYDNYLNDCKKANKKLPWERKNYSMSYTIKQIKSKHKLFYNITKDKYFQIYPNAKKLLQYFENHPEKETYELYNKKYYNDFMSLINKIQYEFHLMYPEKYAKYEKWCSYYNHLLPKNVVLKLLMIDNYKDYIDYLIKACR